MKTKAAKNRKIKMEKYSRLLIATYTLIRAIVVSNYFFWVVLFMFALQAFWFATSFHYPMLFDEKFHFEITQAFTDKWLPYIDNESAGIDYYRDLSTRAGLLFHFFMSLPLRFFQFIGVGDISQFVLLRYINVFAVILGLIVYRKLLIQARLNNGSINIGMLVFAMLPMSTYVAATINYDNFIFLLFALFVAVCVKAVAGRDINIGAVLMLVTIGCVAGLMKFTFIPIFAAGIFFILINLIQRKGYADAWRHLFYQVKNFSLSKPINIILILLMIVSVGMFSSIYIKNTILYGSPSPACTATLSKDECMKSELENRNASALETKDERTTMQLIDYVAFDWLRSMTSGFSYVVANTESGVSTEKPLPIAYSVMTFGIISALFIIILGRRYIPRNITISVLGTLSLVTIIALLAYNINSYYKYHDIFANQARYLLTVMPLLLVLSIHIANKLIGNKRFIKLGLMVMLIFTLTQGAGATAYLLRSDPEWFVDRAPVQNLNESLRSTIEPFVIRYEGGP